MNPFRGPVTSVVDRTLLYVAVPVTPTGILTVAHSRLVNGWWLMPIYEYQAREPDKGCAGCREPFELLRKIADAPLENCPECGALIQKVISSHSVGGSKSGFDARAKSAGFHKLQRSGKGEYEKKY